MQSMTAGRMMMTGVFSRIRAKATPAGLVRLDWIDPPVPRERCVVIDRRGSRSLRRLLAAAIAGAGPGPGPDSGWVAIAGGADGIQARALGGSAQIGVVLLGFRPGPIGEGRVWVLRPGHAAGLVEELVAAEREARRTVPWWRRWLA